MTNEKTGAEIPSSVARTWVAVFDGGHAVVFENEGFDDAPNLRAVFSADNGGAPTRDLGSDRGGRFRTPQGGHAAAETTDLHARQEHAFVEDIAARLEGFAYADKFDRLVVIAQSKWRSLLRHKAPTADARITAFYDGDFARSPVSRIEEAFRAAVAP